MRMTSTQRIYFVDHNTHTTTWDDTRLPAVDADPDAPQVRDLRKTMTASPASSSSFSRTVQLELRLVRVLGARWSRHFFHKLDNIYGCFEIINLRLTSNVNLEQDLEHLDYFKFISHLLELLSHAVFYHRLDAHLADYEPYKCLTWMLENGITGVLDETFSMTEDRFSEHWRSVRLAGSMIPQASASKTSGGARGALTGSSPVGRLNSAAFNTFRNADLRGLGSSPGGGSQLATDTELFTVHQNTITDIRPYEGAPGAVSRRDEYEAQRLKTK
ncbi:hypothetical protein EDB85DRAFT_2143829 [Lactarius pseudohatsudake]|nr:hypothetical protein EDB85DRAFT_2143829 [Lactarius pseudohatsudake]